MGICLETMMGLDTVELVMEMEETFGIVIDDLDAEHIGTVGQAYRYILGKLELKHSSPCPSAALFYRLRRALMARSGADRRSIRPAARIEDFLPTRSRRHVWIGLRDEVGMTMPRLQYGPGLMLAVWFLGLTQVLGLSALVIFTQFSTPVVMSSLVLGLLSWIMIHQILDPFATEIPRGCQTVRGTVETILGRHRLSREGDIRTWQRDEVWFTLRELISEQMGVPQEQVTEEKSFVNDFGMD